MNELWVANRAGDSMTIFTDLPNGNMNKKANAAGNYHFMPQMSAFAFGDGVLATIHEEDQPTQGAYSPADFMGPSLWDAHPEFFDGGHPSHLDMLHNTPNGMGIAWERDNVFWVFDGYHNSISRYDFHEDHDYGGADHSDGEMWRYVEGEVSYVPDVPSHMVFDPETAALYIADTGNNRIAILDTKSGEPLGPVYPNYDGIQLQYGGATIKTLIDGNEHFMKKPCGLELHNGLLYVSDNATGEIAAFNLDGEPVDWIDTELPSGALMGMAFDAEGRLHYVDAINHQVIRLAAKSDGGGAGENPNTKDQ
jgi:hypothetical protein